MGCAASGIFIGILAVALVYLVGRKVYNHTIGLIAATLTAISSPLILYSTNARGYMPQATLVLRLVLVVEALISAEVSPYG
jgi:asparagine N-glycosylation enzyme membrane subunit Stt3